MSESFDGFTRRVPGFAGLSPTDKICHAAWYLHSVKGADHISTSTINALFNEIHAVPPPTAVYLRRMAERKPPLFIKTKNGYRLERAPRLVLEEKYGAQISTIAVSKMLSDLLEKVDSANEATFLQETLRCYSIKAFRATVVMAWNLAYDHLVRWVVATDERVTKFNGSYKVKYPKRTNALVSVGDFEELKEFETIETCQHAKLISKNTAEILKEKLKRRNAAAHPSSVVVTQAQADDVITDLVHNIVLYLS